VALVSSSTWSPVEAFSWKIADERSGEVVVSVSDGRFDCS